MQAEHFLGLHGFGQANKDTGWWDPVKNSFSY